MMDKRIEVQSEAEWTPATEDDMKAIASKRESRAPHALVMKRNGVIKGWMTYFIGEPDDVIPARRMYIEWLEVEQDVRSVRTTRSFIKNLSDFLLRERIETIDCEVRDGAEGGVLLKKMYSRYATSVEYFPDEKLTLFELTRESIANMMHENDARTKVPEHYSDAGGGVSGDGDSTGADGASKVAGVS